MAGQNIAYFYTYGDLDTTENYIRYAVENWFRECLNTPLAVIKSLYNPPSVKIGHFTQIIQDRNTHVGCAMVSWSDVDFEYEYLYDDGYENYGDTLHIRQSVRITCNYFRGNYLHQPVYEEGTPCSKCGLCDPAAVDSALCSE